MTRGGVLGAGQKSRGEPDPDKVRAGSKNRLFRHEKATLIPRDHETGIAKGGFRLPNTRCEKRPV
jgi:hypothetical protein